MAAKLTYHYYDRAQQRLGLSHRQAKQLARKALRSGTQEQRRRFSDDLTMLNGANSNTRYFNYRQNWLVFTDGKFVTVYPSHRPRSRLYHQGKKQIHRPYQYYRRYADDDLIDFNDEDSDTG